MFFKRIDNADLLPYRIEESHHRQCVAMGHLGTFQGLFFQSFLAGPQFPFIATDSVRNADDLHRFSVATENGYFLGIIDVLYLQIAFRSVDETVSIADTIH